MIESKALKYIQWHPIAVISRPCYSKEYRRIATLVLFLIVDPIFCDAQLCKHIPRPKLVIVFKESSTAECEAAKGD